MPTQNYRNQIFSTINVDGKESSAATLGSQEPNSTMDRCIVDGHDAEWGLKMPNNVGSRITDSHIDGGRERALDIVRGHDIQFDGTYFANGGTRPVTKSRFSLRKTCDIGVKGMASVAFSNCVMTDILIGDFSIYDHAETLPPTVVFLRNNCRHPVAGKPIIVRILNGHLSVDSTVKVKVMHVPQFAVEAYFKLCRRFGDTRAPVVEAST